MQIRGQGLLIYEVILNGHYDEPTDFKYELKSVSLQKHQKEIDFIVPDSAYPTDCYKQKVNWQYEVTIVRELCTRVTTSLLTELNRSNNKYETRMDQGRLIVLRKQQTGENRS
jgi:hypothetical protein